MACSLRLHPPAKSSEARLIPQKAIRAIPSVADKTAVFKRRSSHLVNRIQNVFFIKFENVFSVNWNASDEYSGLKLHVSSTPVLWGLSVEVRFRIICILTLEGEKRYRQKNKGWRVQRVKSLLAE